MPDDIPKKLGRYEIVRVIGKGAMGVVYEGRDPMIGRRVAIKTCRPDVMENSNLRQEMLLRFDRELRAAGAIQHPNVVTIYDVGEDGDTPYIAMEFVEGSDLRHAVEHRLEYPIPALIEIVAKVSEALHQAHLHGVIHRDIKPANILLPDRGGVKVTDFGIARVPNSEITLDGAIVGTPHYMSPEQFGGDELDGRSDLFSVGIILYELLTGQKPFPGEALSTVMHQVLRKEPITPSQLNPALTPAIDRVMLRTLAKKPGDRYTDGNSMAAALREALKDAPDTEVLDGCAPRKAPTVIANVRPPAPTPEPAPSAPLASSQQSTIKRVEAPSLHDDMTSTLLWPAIGVGLFAALIIVALALRLQVGGAPGTAPMQPAPSNPAPEATPAPAPPRVAPAAAPAPATQPFGVWGADTPEALKWIRDNGPGLKTAELQAKIPDEFRERIHVIDALLIVRDPATGEILLESQIPASGELVALPKTLASVKAQVSAPGHVPQELEIHKDGDGDWKLPFVALQKVPAPTTP